MPLNHSFSIALCNIKLVLKLAVFLLLFGLIAFAVLTAIFQPIFGSFINIIKNAEIDAQQFVNHPFVTVKTQFIDPFIAQAKTQNLGATVVYALLAYFVVNFFIMLTILPVTKVLYNKMTSGYDIGLFNAFVSTGFQNLLLTFILSLFSMVVAIGLTVGFGALFILCLRSKIYLLLPFLILLYIACLSMKTCLYAQWYPEICATQQKNIFIGIKNALRGTFKKFRKNFLCLFTVNVLWFAVVAATLLPTFGAIPLITVPFFLVLEATLGLTLNFSFHQKKYFVNNGETIYNPTKLF